MTGKSVIDNGHVENIVKRRFLVKCIPDLKVYFRSYCSVLQLICEQEFPRIEEVKLEHVFLSSKSDEFLNRIEKRSVGDKDKG